ncbi:hypothetical protein [Nonomuraea rubra]|uniref:hypothetical protein n=1 Tax=Nonomuraea rubra TaxID=46180 RepID=UPI0031EE970F
MGAAVLPADTEAAGTVAAACTAEGVGEAPADSVGDGTMAAADSTGGVAVASVEVAAGSSSTAAHAQSAALAPAASRLNVTSDPAEEVGAAFRIAIARVPESSLMRTVSTSVEVGVPSTFQSWATATPNEPAAVEV